MELNFRVLAPTSILYTERAREPLHLGQGAGREQEGEEEELAGHEGEREEEQAVHEGGREEEQAGHEGGREGS